MGRPKQHLKEPDHTIVIFIIEKLPGKAVHKFLGQGYQLGRVIQIGDDLKAIKRFIIFFCEIGQAKDPFQRRRLFAAQFFPLLYVAVGFGPILAVNRALRRRLEPSPVNVSGKVAPCHFGK